MAVVSIGTPTTASNATGGSVAGTWGASQGRTSGDLLIAGASAMASTSSGAITMTAGWTSFGTHANNTFCDVAFFYKIASGLDTAPTATSTQSGTTKGMAICLWELQGFSSQTNITTSGTGTGTTAAPTATTGANVPAAGCYGLGCQCEYNSTTGSGTWTPTTWTNDAKDISTTKLTHSAFDHYANPPSGSTLSYTGAWGTITTTETAAMLIVITVAPARLTATVTVPGMQDALTANSAAIGQAIARGSQW